jgi:N-acetylglucosamine kinase-like BadF-type ATPase
MTGDRRVVVGVDAGGTSTTAVAACGGTPIGRGRAGPGNAATGSIAGAAEAIATAVEQATGGDVPIAALYVGAAGAGRDATAQALSCALRERLPHVASLVVEHDARIALRSAIPQGSGVVVIAGTGSTAYAERDGECIRVGGAGYLLGDEGSGFAIGMAAVRLLVHAYDNRVPHDETTRLVEDALGVATRDALLQTAYAHAAAKTFDAARVAALAEPIVALAGQGVPTAGTIVAAAAHDLAALAEDAARRARLEAPCVALGGGLLRRTNVLVELLCRRLAETLPACTIVVAREAPELAAVRLAHTASATEAVR